MTEETRGRALPDYTNRAKVLEELKGFRDIAATGQTVKVTMTAHHIDSILSAILTPSPVLVAAMADAAGTFRDYERLHLEKAVDAFWPWTRRSRQAKAAANGYAADKLELAIFAAINGRDALDEVEEARLDEVAQASVRSFDEDHSLGARSWGKGRHESIPKTHGAEGRNWAGD
jgi:hypothetical protein